MGTRTAARGVHISQAPDFKELYDGRVRVRITGAHAHTGGQCGPGRGASKQGTISQYRARARCGVCLRRPGAGRLLVFAIGLSAKPPRTGGL